VSQFVDECRREWKRLHVPDAVANEMAADLAADLKEAEAEGASAEQVVGSGAFDPRAFAASWAAERGVIPPPPPLVKPYRPLPTSRVFAAFNAAAVIGAIGVGLALLASGSASTQIATASAPLGPQPQPVDPGFPMHVVDHSPGVYLHAIGLLVLVVGVVGLILSTLYWSRWATQLRSARASIDENAAAAGFGGSRYL
jgi:hypothetical protein